MKPLTVRRAQAFQKECIAELQRAKRQEVLRQKFEAAGGDIGRQAAALKLVAVPALCEVVPRHGFDVSYVGVCEGLVSLLQRAAESAEVLACHTTLAGLLCPPLKDEMPTLDGTWPKACLQRMTRKGTDILAEYLASLFEFVQSSKQCPRKDDGGTLVVPTEEPSMKACGSEPSIEGLDQLSIDSEVVQASPSHTEEQSLRGIENGLGQPLNLQHVVDVQLNCVSFEMKSLDEGCSAWPEVNQDMLSGALKGMTAARCLALQEEVLALLKQPAFQEQARRAYDSAEPVMQLSSHTVLVFPLIAPVLARYGIEVSVYGLQVWSMTMLFFNRTKKIQDNLARIATLMSVGASPNTRLGLSRSSAELLQRRKELALVHENLKAFRAALDAEPIQSVSDWICIKKSGLAKTTPDLGSFPKYIDQGCLLQVSEALPAPDGSFFLRLEDARGWVRAVGSGSTSGTRSSDYACCVRLGPRAGRRWQVVGGASLGGIKVRKGKELTSPVLGNSERDVRLETGAKVCELELVGERLHYRKVHGTGPDLGWLSIFCKGLALVQVVDWVLDVPELLPERPIRSGEERPVEQ